jgi:hypothetical protein
MSKANKVIKAFEEYEKRVKLGRGTSVEVFFNPSKKELGSVYPYVKFVADNRDKKVWVWDGYDGPLHAPMWTTIKTTKLVSDIKKGYILAGYAGMDSRGSKPVMDDGDGDATTENYFTKHNVDDIADKFKWVNTFIEVDSFIRNYGSK